MGWDYGMHGWGGHWVGGLVMVIFWMLVVVGFAALLRWGLSRGDGTTQAGPESPLEILKRRYAKGEIDKAEFEEKKRDIFG